VWRFTFTHPIRFRGLVLDTGQFWNVTSPSVLYWFWRPVFHRIHLRCNFYLSSHGVLWAATQGNEWWRSEFWGREITCDLPPLLTGFISQREQETPSVHLNFLQRDWPPAGHCSSHKHCNNESINGKLVS